MSTEDSSPCQWKGELIEWSPSCPTQVAIFLALSHLKLWQNHETFLIKKIETTFFHISNYLPEPLTLFQSRYRCSTTLYNFFCSSPSLPAFALSAVSFFNNSWNSVQRFCSGFDLSSHSCRASKIFTFRIKSLTVFSRGKIKLRTWLMHSSKTSKNLN